MCGFDGGDCDEFNEKYTGCSVFFPHARIMLLAMAIVIKMPTMQSVFLMKEIARITTAMMMHSLLMMRGMRLDTTCLTRRKFPRKQKLPRNPRNPRNPRRHGIMMILNKLFDYLSSSSTVCT